ncbi:MAG: MlaE family lipid ABC transporter permease subunit [Pseudomonadota bacterium]
MHPKPSTAAQTDAPAELQWQAEAGVLRASGDWDARGIGDLAEALPKLLAKIADGQSVRFESVQLAHMDTAGALVLLHMQERLLNRNIQLDLSGLQAYQHELIALVQRTGDLTPPAEPPKLNPLESIGKSTLDVIANAYDTLVFMGEVITRTIPLLLQPWRLRWGVIINEIQAAGTRSVPIVALLTFLIGVVIAYQSGITMQQYGATVFLPDMIGIVTLREMGPLITAIVVAGRTGSSYAAAIGTMKVTQEVDALRSLAISPVEMLVIPRVFALVIALPLLTVMAMAMGLYGGILIATEMYGLDMHVALNRLSALANSNFWVGMIKTPVFALAIAMIGCHEGMKVRGSAADVGRSTTASVVQAIFWVIVIDAAFAVLFSKLGL